MQLHRDYATADHQILYEVDFKFQLYTKFKLSQLHSPSDVASYTILIMMCFLISRQKRNTIFKQLELNFYDPSILTSTYITAFIQLFFFTFLVIFIKKYTISQSNVTFKQLEFIYYDIWTSASGNIILKTKDTLSTLFFFGFRIIFSNW